MRLQTMKSDEYGEIKNSISEISQRNRVTDEICGRGLFLVFKSWKMDRETRGKFGKIRKKFNENLMRESNEGAELGQE